MSLNSRLDQINDEMAVKLIPAIMLVVIYMIIGLLGNPLVAYFYSQQTKSTPSFHFIVALAVFDMIACTVSMPLEIVDMRHSFKFDNTTTCKTLRFVNYFASISSSTILLAIATDRYRKICHPFYQQISLKMTKILIIVTCVLSFCLSWPSFVFYGSVKINITGVEGFDCTIIRERSYTKYITVYNITLFVLFTITIICLISLYCLIGRELFNLKKFRMYATSPYKKNNKIEGNKMNSESTSGCSYQNPNFLSDADDRITIIATEKNASSNCKNPIVKSDKDAEKEIKNTSKCSKTSEDHRDITNKLSEKEETIDQDKHKLKQQEIDTRKYTVLMLSITVSFVVSFLPYLGLQTWRTTQNIHEYDLLHGSGQVAYQIFIRSFLISSAVNPILYGFFNSEFRTFVKDLCCKVFCIYCKSGIST